MVSHLKNSNYNTRSFSYLRKTNRLDLYTRHRHETFGLIIILFLSVFVTKQIVIDRLVIIFLIIIFNCFFNSKLKCGNEKEKIPPSLAWTRTAYSQQGLIKGQASCKIYSRDPFF